MINRRAMLQVAMNAANDSEWGYESEDALAWLKEMDPDYDWDMPLFEAELEAGHRTMGPRTPPTEMERALMAMYLPMLKRQVEATDAFFKVISRD